MEQSVQNVVVLRTRQNLAEEFPIVNAYVSIAKVWSQYNHVRLLIDGTYRVAQSKIPHQTI